MMRKHKLSPIGEIVKRMNDEKQKAHEPYEGNAFYTIRNGSVVIDVEKLHRYATKYNMKEDAEGIRKDFYNALAIAKTQGDRWNDIDPKYPDNLHHEGFTLHGYTFISYYSGIAGDYWYTGQYGYPVCRPW